MNKFLFYCTDFDGNSAIISDEDFRHCVKVLRYSAGDQIQCTDGEGNHLFGVIDQINKKDLQLKIEDKKFSPERENQLHIAIAPTKNMSRIETMVEKCVEIGIDEISFIKTKNSERKHIKVERIQKIALSAMKQSFRTRLPKINELVSLKEFLNLTSVNDSKYLMHYNPGAAHLLSGHWSHRNIILIGPEGDFTNEEISQCNAAGFETMILGNSKLRTETAGIVACTIFNAKLSTL